ncbi:MAG: LptF/LptG family permease [Luteolibacter sp.]
MLFFRNHLLRFLLPLALIAVGIGLCAILVPAESAAVKQQILGFPDSDVQAHHARPMVLAILCFLPALASLVYCFGGTLDRYIARQFAGIFGICLAALFTIWLLIDLTDKIGDFRESKHVIYTILLFYGTRLPAVLLLLLPYSLLLSLLYSLGKLSTTREITAMIQSGRGVFRITLPVIIAGFFLSLLSLGLNYHWAPTAEGAVDFILADATGKQANEASNVLYRNAKTRRLWMIGGFPQDYQLGKELLNVEVTTTRPDETLESRLFAKRALWDRQTRTWSFVEPVIGHFQPGQPAEFQTEPGPLRIKSWSETPWQLIKPGLSAAYLGIPDLNGWLNSNFKNAETTDASPYLTQWHYRWALPFTCLVTVLLATPLSIHFARRGAGGGVFIAVVLSALMLLTSNISLALGEAGTLRPAQAAWLPNVAFTLLGLYLFHRRISGRPIYRSLLRFLPGND